MKLMKIIIALALSATGTAALPITAAANADEVAARPPAYATGAELAAALDADLRASAALSGPRSAAGSAPIPVWTPEIIALFKEMNLPTCDGAEATACAETEYVKDNVCTACPSGYTCNGATAAERAECLAGSEGSCEMCCAGITGKCQEITVSGTDYADLYKIPGLTEQDDCLLLTGNYNKVDATSPRLKRPWLFFASARRVGLRRRRRDRRRGRRQPPLRQRLPRPSGIPIRRRLVRARPARRLRRRFAHA